MRAVSVRVNEVIGVAGFVVPGTHVDVMVTMRRDVERDTMTRVVVSDVQVLTAVHGTTRKKRATVNRFRHRSLPCSSHRPTPNASRWPALKDKSC